MCLRIEGGGRGLQGYCRVVTSRGSLKQSKSGDKKFIRAREGGRGGGGGVGGFFDCVS